MKNQKLSVLFVIFIVLCFNFTACRNPSGEDYNLTDLRKYQNAGGKVAEKTWSEDYDCSNFSTQFFQNCYKSGLPCRVRLGKSGGNSFSVDDHAWNSVKIDGIWVNWEPQLNSVYNSHTQTRTSMGPDWGTFVLEDIVRIIYENIGKYVPSSIIDAYEIDAHWRNNSPYYQYFLSESHCLSDDPDPDAKSMVSFLQGEIPDNNSGDIFITDKQHLLFLFKYNNKYYGIENLEEDDPLEGRSVTKKSNLKEIIISGTEFTKLDINFDYKAESGL
jgi:hypothetical protein